MPMYRGMKDQILALTVNCIATSSPPTRSVACTNPFLSWASLTIMKLSTIGAARGTPMQPKMRIDLRHQLASTQDYMHGVNILVVRIRHLRSRTSTTTHSDTAIQPFSFSMCVDTAHILNLLSTRPPFLEKSSVMLFFLGLHR